MSSNPRHKNQGPELLVDLMEKTAHILEANGGLSQEKSGEIAIALADLMAASWGGSRIYFPKGTWNGNPLRCFRLAARDWNIYREFDGTNRIDICARYRISTPRLYQILAACRHHLAATRKAKPAPF